MAAFYVLHGPSRGRSFPLVDETILLGRQSEEVALADHTVSRRHAELIRHNNHWVITDLGSSNGTYLNGERIDAPSRIEHGDQIKIGSSVLIFRTDASDSGQAPPGSTPQAIGGTGGEEPVDSSILSAVESSEDSIILAAPETADAVRAWNLMSQLVEATGSIDTVDGFLERVADITQQHLLADHVVILMGDQAADKMTPRVVRRHSQNDRNDDKIATSKTIINHVIETRSAVLCANAKSDQRFGRGKATASLHNLGLRSIICVPIIAREKVTGVIHLDCAIARHTYTSDQLRLATAVGRMSGMAIEHLQLLDEKMQTERLAAVGETVAFLSHHIRNILQGMRSGADVLEMGIERSEPQTVQTGWKIVQQNFDRIFQLTTNMLTFSRESKPRIELAQLNKIVTDAVSLAKRQADEKRVDIVPDLRSLPVIPVDAEGIHQAVFNLLLNAIAACPDQGGCVGVRTLYDAPKEEVVLRIEDNGSGIEPEQMKTLFKPFQTSKGHAGTGLGLAAAKKIVVELSGWLDVQSAPGNGTTFTIRLPATRTQILEFKRTHDPDS